MNIVDNIAALRASARETQQPNLADVHYLAKRAEDKDHDFLDKDSWGRWDSWNDWGAAS